MSRRNLLKTAGAAGAAAGLGALIKSETSASATPALAAEEHDHDDNGKPISGPLANATVTFGGWQSGPAPYDRFVVPNDRTRNHHHLTPNVAKIEEGGTVNFIIGGFHNVIVYDHGTQPKDIDRTKLVAGSVPPLIDDPKNRIYRGLDPGTVGQDRVETVQFAKAGLFLVICGVLPHFFNPTTGQFQMFGYVRVVKKDD
ncbi:MAG TPA: twin-arginine translocation signal domain-containing protein [Terriglobia bacterium]|nr:twin-arginine translocation signal domain-containing protein [Terriglobia bacterium]